MRSHYNPLSRTGQAYLSVPCLPVILSAAKNLSWSQTEILRCAQNDRRGPDDREGVCLRWILYGNFLLHSECGGSDCVVYNWLICMPCKEFTLMSILDKELRPIPRRHSRKRL